MPPMKLCPNRNNHPSHRLIDTSRNELEYSKYKIIRHKGKRPIRFLPEDKMVRLYYNTKDHYVKLGYWYCIICGCVVSDSFIESNLVDSRELVFLKP